MPNIDYTGRRVVVTALVLLASTNGLNAAPTPEQRRESQLLLDQALEHGSTWRQGVVEVSISRESPRPVKREEFLAFDHDAGLMRFDCEESERWDDTEWRCKVIVSPVETLRWTGDNFTPTMVLRHLPGQAPRIPNAEPIELNGIAVADAVTVVNHFDLQMLQEFYRDRFSFTADRVVAYRRDGTKITATWELPAINQEGRPFRRQFTFDMASGGLPVRVVSEVEEAGTGNWETFSQTMMTWRAAGDTFVPATWDSADTNSDYELSMTFDWKSLNEELPENLFTLEDFEVDPRTLVMNTKLGAPIIEGTMQEVRHPPGETAGFEVSGGTRYWLIAVNAVLLALIVAIVVWRYRRSSVQ